MRGQRDSAVLSQRKEESPKVTKTRLRYGEDFISEIEGQVSWSAEKQQKS